MIQFLVAAPCSGSGKTTLTCALLAALKRRGQDPCDFAALILAPVFTLPCTIK